MSPFVNETERQFSDQSDRLITTGVTIARRIPDRLVKHPDFDKSDWPPTCQSAR
jgi:hypothetical protein